VGGRSMIAPLISDRCQPDTRQGASLSDPRGFDSLALAHNTACPLVADAMRSLATNPASQLLKSRSLSPRDKAGAASSP
jgi:hypothetical protein